MEGTLAPNPCLGVKAVLQLAQLELQYIVGRNGAKRLAGAYLLTTMNVDRTKVAVYRDVYTVANHNHKRASITEHGTNLAVVYGTGLTTRLTHDVDALVVDGYARQSGNRVLTIVAHDARAARDRHRQTSFVGLEASRHHTVDRRHGSTLLYALLSRG